MQAFVNSAEPIGVEPSDKRKVLITGAAGNIGSFLADYAKDRYHFRLAVHPEEETDARDEGLDKLGEIVPVLLDDLPALTRACEGMDTVVHLAASPGPSTPWDKLLPNNIVGTYHAFVAAEAAGCRRLIYASSIHAVSGHPEGLQVHHDDPVNPGDLYGVTKCFGEAMGRYMAEQRGLSVIAIRIGAFQPEEKAEQPDAIPMMDAFVSQRDLAQLICRCIDDRSLRFAILHGLSDNRFNVMEIESAKRLVGYEPQDSFTAENPELKDLHLDERVTGHDEERGGEPGIREELEEAKAATN